MEMTLSGGGERSNASCHYGTQMKLNSYVLTPPLPQRHVAQSNLKAMTMTRARMVPCMNRWLMQP